MGSQYKHLQFTIADTCLYCQLSSLDRRTSVHTFHPYGHDSANFRHEIRVCSVIWQWSPGLLTILYHRSQGRREPANAMNCHLLSFSKLDFEPPPNQSRSKEKLDFRSIAIVTPLMEELGHVQTRHSCAEQTEEKLRLAAH